QPFSVSAQTEPLTLPQSLHVPREGASGPSAIDTRESRHKQSARAGQPCLDEVLEQLYRISLSKWERTWKAPRAEGFNARTLSRGIALRHRNHNTETWLSTSLRSPVTLSEA